MVIALEDIEISIKPAVLECFSVLTDACTNCRTYGDKANRNYADESIDVLQLRADVLGKLNDVIKRASENIKRGLEQVSARRDACKQFSFAQLKNLEDLVKAGRTEVLQALDTQISKHENLRRVNILQKEDI